MDYFSLEDDDGDYLFFTQESKESDVNTPEKMDIDGESFLGLPKTDFSSPCTSLTRNVTASQYLDISDDESFPNSQNLR